MSIVRIEPNKRMSNCVVHNDTVYLAGMVGTAGAPVPQQMADILADIDDYLGRAGSDKSKILSATVWLSDLAHFDAMNAAWEAWLPEGAAPARATAQVALANPGWAVEIIIVAAK